MIYNVTYKGNNKITGHQNAYQEEQHYAQTTYQTPNVTPKVVRVYW
jgi:hypothetical protein